MIKKTDILDIYTYLKTAKTDIPDNVIEFMKETCLSELEKEAEVYVCTDFNLSLTDMKMRKKKIIQSPNGEIYTVKITRR